MLELFVRAHADLFERLEAVRDERGAEHGEARIACTTEDGKAVLAVGTGIGTSIVAGVLTAVFGVIGVFAAFSIVFVLRRRTVRRNANR